MVYSITRSARAGTAGSSGREHRTTEVRVKLGGGNRPDHQDDRLDSYRLVVDIP